MKFYRPTKRYVRGVHPESPLGQVTAGQCLFLRMGEANYQLACPACVTWVHGEGEFSSRWWSGGEDKNFELVGET